MYNTHAAEIKREALAHAGAFRSTLEFVLATIQEPLERVPTILDDVAKRGARSQWLWGMKARGYLDIRDKHERLHALTLHALGSRAPLWREKLLVTYITELHGIGLAKAGFILQLTAGAVGCIDTHNRQRFGVTKLYVSPSAQPKTILKHAACYVRLCDALGGSAYLWDSWCAYVAEKRPQAFPDAEAVSAAHLRAVYPF